MPRTVLLVALLIAPLALVACGAEEPAPQIPIPRPATAVDLVGPWQAIPFVIDAGLRAKIEQTCRRDIEMPPGSLAAVIDVRGERVATIRMTGQNPGSCDALELTDRGEVTGAGAGWRQDQPEVLPELAPGAVGRVERQTVQGGGLDVRGWSVYGRIGPSVAAVEVAPERGPSLAATVENGWFAAWWPVQPGDPDMNEGFQPKVIVRGYDALGTVLSEARSP